MSAKVPAHMKGIQKSQVDKKREVEEKNTEIKGEENEVAKVSRAEQVAKDSDELEQASKENSNNKLNNDSSLNSNISAINELLNVALEVEEKKKTKEKANLYLDEETMNKLRTLSEKTNKSITTIVEDLLVQVLVNVEVDENAVRKYKKKNKARGNKNSNKNNNK